MVVRYTPSINLYKYAVTCAAGFNKVFFMRKHFQVSSASDQSSAGNAA